MKMDQSLGKLLLLCYHYNPITGKYGATILNVLRACGIATVLGLAHLFFWQGATALAPTDFC